MSVEQRRLLFLAVRDLPYGIREATMDTSCVVKTKLLGELLTRSGLECRVWRATIPWEATGIPAYLLALAPRPIFSHYFLKVRISEAGKWVIVDATWDQRFRGILPVNEWDGQTDTVLAYPSEKLERVGKVSDFDFRDFDPTDTFTNQLNEWYRSLTKRK